MAAKPRLAVETASPDQSVWQNLDRNTFQRNIVALQQASNEVPADPVVYAAHTWQANRDNEDVMQRRLPFEVEQRLADDLALVAAASEGHKEISAVVIEEYRGSAETIVRVAANEGVSPVVSNLLQTMFDVLKPCAYKSTQSDECDPVNVD